MYHGKRGLTAMFFKIWIFFYKKALFLSIFTCQWLVELLYQERSVHVRTYARAYIWNLENN